MKLSDFRLPDEGDSARLLETIAGFNRTRTAYPRDRTVPDLFAEQAARTPDAPAVLCEQETVSYSTLDRRSNGLAALLTRRRIGRGDFVLLMMDRSPAMVEAMLGVLKAGAAYVPVAPDQPFDRIRHVAGDTAARLLIFDRACLRTANRLQWECPALETILCLDSEDIQAEVEPDAGLMAGEIWDHVADSTFDDISGGGWTSSYTGEWLSRAVMDGYGENVRAKLAPLLTPASRVLEIGCASGITMFRIAPLVARYVGTDLSPGIVDWSRGEAGRLGQANIEVVTCAAHEIDRLGSSSFDLVIVNSVIECFPGHNYLRRVIRSAVDLLAGTGWLFLGNLWDLDLKPAFLESLVAWKRSHPRDRTKTERSDELYISRRFLDDLRHEIPAIRDVQCSTMLGAADSELSRFGFDALLRVDKDDSVPPAAPRRRWQLDRRARAEAAAAPRPSSVVGPLDLAYVMYTSGTAGTPKGAMIEHRSILRLVKDTTYIQLGRADRILQTGALSFDASTFEIWGPLLNGGAVCLPRGRSFLAPVELGRLLRRHGVTVLFLTTGLFNQLVDTDPTVLSTVRTLLTGGEKVSARHMNAVRRACPGLALKHVYGPTESTTFATCYDVIADHDHDVPIGAPISNTTAWIVDDRGALAPVGVPGELLLGGDGLARGYLNDAELTARKFVPGPVGGPERVYRTGDLARWLPEGTIEFLGRIDTQVKVRGYRIEVEEVESVVLQQPGVTQAAVVARGPDGDRSLVAYVSGHALSADDLRAALRETLPDYMVPVRIAVFDSLPLNTSGKVDRRALPALRAIEGQRAAADAPTSATEVALAGVWASLLDRTDVGLDDDFFELGGHSLTVIRLIARVQATLGAALPIGVVFRAPTIRELARYVDDTRRVDPRILEDEVVPLSRSAGRLPIFAFPPGSGYPLAYQELARHLPDVSFYGFAYLDGPDLLDRYVRTIARLDPDGPVVLLGYSAGGKLAYRVAQALEASGRRVAGVILLDAARYLRPVRFSEDDVQEAAREFAGEVASVALREQIVRRVRQYRTFVGGLVEHGRVDAELHLLKAAGSTDYVVDGEVVATLERWGALTTGRCVLHAGAGAHRDMLAPPHVAANAARIRSIVEAWSTDRPTASVSSPRAGHETPWAP